MIWVTGDTHIPHDIHKLNTDCFPEQKTLSKTDYLIICGDFGGVWDGSNTDKYWVSWLNDKPFTTLFIDGNHENFDMLNSYPVSEYCGGKVHQIAQSVYHLMRGQVFIIDGLKVFTMGGAVSHDKARRKKGKSWWPEEVPSEDENAEAIRNLDKNNWAVDLVITHCAPTYLLGDILAQRPECNGPNDFLDVIRTRLSFSMWYFGHYHIDRQIENYTAIYEIIEKVGVTHDS